MKPIQGIETAPLQNPTTGSAVSKAEKNFAQMLTGIVDEVSNQQKSADRAMEQVHTGDARNLHEAMIAMEQADISIRLMVQVRNKALEAYQEIMRMQV